MAAAAARLLSSTAARSLRTGLGYTSAAKKMVEVAEELTKVLKEAPSEAANSKAKALVNQLKGFYPASPMETQLKELATRASQLEKTYEIRFMKIEHTNEYLTVFSFGMYFLFTASFMAVPAAIYHYGHDLKDVSSEVKVVTSRVDTLEANKAPTKVEVGVKFPQQ